MKKSIVSALTTALVVGAASTTFAAANPFEDVPASHWAYDAIAQLAADGVIEGYGDGTYRGDQEITRYEMAQMIARAMAKNPSGADKALIDKLAAEFADELNNLGVRVAALEKKVDNVKWQGAVRYRWIADRSSNEFGNVDNDHQYVTLRLEPEMQINKNWTGHARLDYHSDMDSAQNTTGNSKVRSRFGDADDSGFVMERVWVQGDYNNVQILLGKLPYITNIDNGMFFDDNVAGGQLTVGNKVKATVTVGRTDNLAEDEQERWSTTASYQGIEIYNDREDKITWGVAYHHVANKAYWTQGVYDGKEKKAANIWEVGLGWQFAKDFNLNGAYAWNTTGDPDGKSGTAKAWTVELDYKGADPEEPWSWGAFVAYRKLGANAVLAPTYDAHAGADHKGWEIGVDVVPMKNFMATIKYFHGKCMNLGDNDTNHKTLFTELNFFF
ncbi:MAG: putative porin [Schwartzia sp.]|nr:putative porin [Schwartzia sp. (in: firmicutes)]